MKRPFLSLNGSEKVATATWSHRRCGSKSSTTDWRKRMRYDFQDIEWRRRVGTPWAAIAAEYGARLPTIRGAYSRWRARKGKRPAPAKGKPRQRSRSVFDDRNAFPPLPVDYEAIIRGYARKQRSVDTFHLLTIKGWIELETGREATIDDWYGVKSALKQLVQSGILETVEIDRFRMKKSE